MTRLVNRFLAFAILAFASSVLLPGALHAQLAFNPVQNVSTTAGHSRHPHLEIDGAGVLHVAWAGDTGSPGSYRILYRRSLDQGQSFTSTVQVSVGTGAALRPRLATSGNSVYLVWTEDVSDTKDILFARSLDGGVTWQAPVNLSNTPGHSREARVAVDAAGTIYVVWDEESPSRHIALTRSSNGGSSFETPRMLFAVAMSTTCTSVITGACTPYPGIAVDRASGRVYVVWHDRVGGADLQVFFSRSLDGGNTFSAPLNISQAVIHAHCATVTVGPSGTIHVAYEKRKDTTEHKHDAYYVQSRDGGVSFSTPLNLSNGPGFAASDYPWPVEGSNGLIVVGWEDSVQ